MASQSKEKLSRELSEIKQELEKKRKRVKVYEDDNDTWWNGLSEAEREDAFYAVVKRIHKSELKDGGSYRHALYDVFGFGPNMYTSGMDCGFMALHNAIFDGEELVAMKCINRFEVIDETGRAYTKYLKDGEFVEYILQDSDHTLKVFIDKVVV
jgi:hypothetical protein